MSLAKIYGERNTGTIYLEWLLRKNLGVEISKTYELGWKHRLAPSEIELPEKFKKEVLFLCLVKNPYSWLMSMNKNPQLHYSLQKLKFSEFIRYSYGDYRNPVIMWNAKNKSYVELSQYVEKYEMIKYEEILAEPENFIDKLTRKYGFEKHPFFKNIQMTISQSRSLDHRHFHKDYYLEEKWKKRIRREDIKFINEFLDKELMKLFNYSYL